MSEFKIELLNPERTNLLCLILRTMLNNAAHNPSKLNLLKKAQGSYLIKAGRMKGFLKIEPEGAKIKIYEDEKFDNYIEGTILSFFKLGSGSLSPVPLIKRDLKVWGNLVNIGRLGLILRNR